MTILVTVVQWVTIAQEETHLPLDRLLPLLQRHPTTSLSRAEAASGMMEAHYSANHVTLVKTVTLAQARLATALMAITVKTKATVLNVLQDTLALAAQRLPVHSLPTLMDLELQAAFPTKLVLRRIPESPTHLLKAAMMASILMVIRSAKNAQMAATVTVLSL